MACKVRTDASGCRKVDWGEGGRAALEMPLLCIYFSLASLSRGPHVHKDPRVTASECSLGEVTFPNVFARTSLGDA